MKKFIKNIKHKYSEYRYFSSFNRPGTKYNIFLFIWDMIDYDIIYRIKHLYNVKTCAKKGHKWHHECDITPDYGSESMECTRCGEYHNITHY
jgi:hypothetical protein